MFTIAVRYAPHATVVCRCTAHRIRTYINAHSYVHVMCSCSPANTVYVTVSNAYPRGPVANSRLRSIQDVPPSRLSAVRNHFIFLSERHTSSHDFYTCPRIVVRDTRNVRQRIGGIACGRNIKEH
jgi:hypothetical protein